MTHLYMNIATTFRSSFKRTSCVIALAIPVVLRATYKAIYDTLDNQLADNDPPETRETIERLIATGRDEEEARRLIANVIAAEVFAVLKYRMPYDRDRFVARLNSLPDLSFMGE